MTIKPPPSHVQQLLPMDLLPGKPISRNGEARNRNRYGTACNEIVNGLLGLEDIPNSGSHDIVFDAYARPVESYVEVKSLRYRNKAPIYDWRRTKDRDAGVPLLYVFGIHDCKGCTDMGQLWHRMAETLCILLVMPAWALDLEARRHPLRKIGQHETPSGARNGYQRAGYREGYRNVPYVDLARLALGGQKRLTGATIHGIDFTAMACFHPAITPWL